MSRASRLLTVALAAAVAAGCSLAPSGGNGPAAAGSGPAGASDTPARLSTGHYVQTETPPFAISDTLRISTAADTGTLDLHSISHANAQWLGRLIFDNLVYLDDQGRPTPWLAQSWTISPDGLTYVFHLRQGVTFSDDTPFDAQAVKANLEHMRDPATKSPLAAAYIAPYAQGRVIDRYTFEARLSRPYAPFLNVLAQSWLALISPRQIREAPATIASHPIGSGPFVVASYERQRGIRLVRRPDYDWAPPFLHHRGAAYAQGIDIDFLPEGLIRYVALASGQYDLTIDAPPQNAAAIRADPALVLDNRIRTGIVSRGVAFNVARAPFDELAVRQALCLATDRQAIARAVGFGEYLPKTDFLGAATRDYDAGGQGILARDPARANRLLDAAGWTGRDPQGFRTRHGQRLGADVLVTQAQNLFSVLVALQADARAIGFDLRIVQLTMPMLTQRRMAGDYQALASGVWHTNTPDALYINYAGAEIASKKRIGQNTSRLQDAELDRLLEAARAAPDEATRALLYARAQARLAWLAPAIPLYENHALSAYRRSLHGVLYDTSHNTPVLIAAWKGQGA
ncbi:MAG TPA: ABC transporter substrate-binding protein [Novosphingobium capsulatum]|nr:ABC transporter substrate-binding protein [Novosphingobium aromaticivorans]HIQ16396.1 ABC transporter substrate-binding protein [Novosphingobium capsulatum]